MGVAEAVSGGVGVAVGSAGGSPVMVTGALVSAGPCDTIEMSPACVSITGSAVIEPASTACAP